MFADEFVSAVEPCASDERAACVSRTAAEEAVAERGASSAAGPDRVSGGQWTEPYAREYFRCVTETGALVWLFRDARENEWYLHGWWD